MAYRYKSGEGVLRDIWPKGDGIFPPLQQRPWGCRAWCLQEAAKAQKILGTCSMGHSGGADVRGPG